MAFNLKEMKPIVEAMGYDYKNWENDILNKRRMQIIDKDREYYSEWKNEVLNKELEILIKAKAFKLNTKRENIERNNG